MDTAFLVGRVRSQILEPYSNDDQQRSDAEITSWLQAGQMDYVAKTPADSHPGLVKHATFSTSFVAVPSDYLKILQVEVSHTVSGTETETTTAFILPSDGGYIADHYDGAIGAWAQFRQGSIYTGPSVYAGTLTYQRRPITLASGCPTFDLGDEHADPIIDFATSKALQKLNDEDSAGYMQSYELRVKAENQRHGLVYEIEKQD